MPGPKKILRNVHQDKTVAKTGKVNRTNKRKQTPPTAPTVQDKMAKKGTMVAIAEAEQPRKTVQERELIEAAPVVPKKKVKKGAKQTKAANAEVATSFEDHEVPENGPGRGAGKAAVPIEPVLEKQGPEKNVEVPAASGKNKRGRKAAQPAQQVNEKEAVGEEQLVGASEKIKVLLKTMESDKEADVDVVQKEVELLEKKRRTHKATVARGQMEAKVIPEEQQKIAKAPIKNAGMGSKVGDAKKRTNQKVVIMGKDAKLSEDEKIDEQQTVKAKADSKSTIARKLINMKWAEEQKKVSEVPKASKPCKAAGTRKQTKPVNLEDEQTSSTIYDFTVKDANGGDVCLAKYKGHAVLIVNVASRCGHTKKNYTQLKEIYDKYREQGLRIAAFPCNQFGGQEPGTAADVQNKIAEKYGFEPDFYAKISVNGNDADPLYKFLKREQGNGEPIKWNFAKFLVDKNGFVVKRYLPTTQPNDLVGDVETVLANGRP